MPKSPRQVRREIQEAVSEQVRDLPIHAVRLAMFGVGRALLLSDRVTRDYKELRESGVGPVLERLGADARQLSGQVVGRVVHRENGQAAPVLERDIPVAHPPARPRPTPEPVIEVEPEVEAAVDLPVPDYDSASLAAVRARLRALSAAQVSKLRDYEATHADRPEFVRMFDNRIAKLTQES